MTGHSVVGFRAPVFSLTRESLWTVDILHDLGFRYSSSVLPSHHPLFGLPEAPRVPFRWPIGLVEIPVPLARFGPWNLPYLGGIYLRYLPKSFVARMRETAPGSQTQWTYIHPYDFDTDEPFCRIRDTALWISVLLWCNRRGSFEKLKALMAHGTAPPFAVQLESGRFDEAEVFNITP